jgi:hypothetical protein
MRTNSRSRGRGLVLAVLALIASMPELARAQQAGLFPNHPIKRQRVPCDQEDPVYRIYKQKYFGYHPTCWSPFPSGWGCPSPEKPDKEKSFRERKLGEDMPELPGTEEGAQGQPAAPITRPDRPVVPPRGRSPFDTPEPNGAMPAAPGEPAAPPRERPRQSPFDLDKPDKPPTAAPDAPQANGNRPSNQPGEDRGPELSAPDQPIRLGGARPRAYIPEDDADARDDVGTPLSLPRVTLPPVVASDTVFDTAPAQASSNPTDAAPNSTGPAASAPRRGFLSGLFNNLGWNWTRR